MALFKNERYYRLKLLKNNIMRKTITIIILILGSYLNAQVGINTEEPEATLDVKSEFLGVQLPRLTNQQIKKIKNPEEGLLVYNVTESCLCINVGRQKPDWKCLTVYTPEKR